MTDLEIKLLQQIVDNTKEIKDKSVSTAYSSNVDIAELTRILTKLSSILSNPLHIIDTTDNTNLLTELIILRKVIQQSNNNITTATKEGDTQINTTLNKLLNRLDEYISIHNKTQEKETKEENTVLNFPASGTATLTVGRSIIDFYTGQVSGNTSGRITGSFEKDGIQAARSFTIYTNKQIDITSKGLREPLTITVLPGVYRVPNTKFQRLELYATQETSIWIAASNVVDGSPENYIITKDIITKTYSNDIIPLQKVTTAPRVVISDTIDVSSASEVDVFVRLGRQTETAFTAGVNTRIEASSRSSGNYWIPITPFTSAVGTNVGSEAITAAVSGQKNLTVASTTNFAQGDVVYIDNSQLSQSEWARVTGITTNANIAIEENLAYTQTNSTVYDQAEFYFAQIDCSSFKRLRVVIDGSGAAQNFVVQADAIISEEGESVI